MSERTIVSSDGHFSVSSIFQIRFSLLFQIWSAWHSMASMACMAWQPSQRKSRPTRRITSPTRRPTFRNIRPSHQSTHWNKRASHQPTHWNKRTTHRPPHCNRRTSHRPTHCNRRTSQEHLFTDSKPKKISPWESRFHRKVFEAALSLSLCKHLKKCVCKRFTNNVTTFTASIGTSFQRKI